MRSPHENKANYDGWLYEERDEGLGKEKEWVFRKPQLHKRLKEGNLGKW